MIAMGVVLIVPQTADAIEGGLNGLVGLSLALGRRLPTGGLIGQAAAGALLALAWAPCAGPTLGAAFALAASRASLAEAIATMFVYALGAAAALLAVGFVLGRISAKTKAAAAGVGRRSFGWSLAVFGALVLTGLDHVVEASIVAAMPNWLANAAAAL